MDLKKFVRLVLQEELKDIEEITVISKDWYYRWNKGETEVYHKETSQTTSTYTYPNSISVDANGRLIIKTI